MLYLGAPKDSVLHLAPGTVAFADMRDERDKDVPFYLKAKRNYGAALTRLREVAGDEQKMSNDRVLAALLIIDNFDVPM